MQQFDFDDPHYEVHTDAHWLARIRVEDVAVDPQSDAGREVLCQYVRAILRADVVVEHVLVLQGGEVIAQVARGVDGFGEATALQ
jgi:hypothetical protein